MQNYEIWFVSYIFNTGNLMVISKFKHLEYLTPGMKSHRVMVGVKRGLKSITLQQIDARL